jgi:ATP-binding cassette subfamily B protein
LRPLQVTNSVLTIGHSLLGVAGVVIAMLILSPLLLAVSMLGFLPLWLATSRISRAVYELMLEMIPNDRKRGYVLGLLTSRDMVKEVRAFGLGGYLRSLYERLSDERSSACGSTCVTAPGFPSWGRRATPWPAGSRSGSSPG